MASGQRRPSPQALEVLRVLGGASEGLYGLEISAATGLKSGSLYPILARLADRGWLTGRWLEPERPGRPARHAYKITAAGKAALRRALAPTAALVAQGAF